MIFNIVFMGIAMFLGFWLIFRKLSLITRLKAIGRPFVLDVAVTGLIMVIYGGTGYGILSATIAGLAISWSISAYRKRYGYIRKNVYYFNRARVNLSEDIKREIQLKLGAAAYGKN